MKYAIEVAKAGSLNKAAQVLMIATPNISRSIKELESDLGITIFERNASGVKLTPEGDEFMGFANEILSQISRVEKYYKDGVPHKRTFSISVLVPVIFLKHFHNLLKKLVMNPVKFSIKKQIHNAPFIICLNTIISLELSVMRKIMISTLKQCLRKKDLALKLCVISPIH